MFQVGGTVLYGMEGVCTIKDITEKKMNDTVRQYYVLEPVHQKRSTVFVPTDNKKLASKMRSVISPKEIDRLIREMPVEPVAYIKEDNARKEVYKEITLRGDCCELIQMARTLRLHQEQMEAQGKKFGAIDTRFLKTAEKMLSDEFSMALNIEPEEVIPYIIKKTH